MANKEKAICLFSGGLDSTTTLYKAIHEGYEVYALTIIYGQVHKKEIECAKIIAEGLGVSHEVINITLPWKGSALLDIDIPIPTKRNNEEISTGIPSTYVPARNTIFISFAASFAEAVGASTIFIGANALDYSGYPDCRPEYFDAVRKMLKLGTKAGCEGYEIKVEAPLLRMSKKEIIELGITFNVPYQKTWSCYQGDKIACGECDACLLRMKGFDEASVKDPLLNYEIPSKS